MKEHKIIPLFLLMLVCIEFKQEVTFLAVFHEIHSCWPTQPKCLASTRKRKRNNCMGYSFINLIGHSNEYGLEN